MKKPDHDQQASPRPLALLRETIRRLDPAALRHAHGGRVSWTRPTTDP